MERQQLVSNSILVSQAKIKDSKELEAISNRVNYLLRKQKKAKQCLNITKLDGASTQVSQQFKNSFNVQSCFGSSQWSAAKKETLYVKTQETKQRNKQTSPVTDRSQLQLNLQKQRKYFERKQQLQKNQKWISQQRFQQQAQKRAKKIKVIKSQRIGRQNVHEFWESRMKYEQSCRETKKISGKLCDMKIQELKIKILQAEQQSLNRLEEILCQQEQVAQRIKTKLKIL